MNRFRRWIQDLFFPGLLNTLNEMADQLRDLQTELNRSNAELQRQISNLENTPVC